jgi:rubredoxin
MISCRHCGKDFDPENLPMDNDVQAGFILAKEKFGDDGKVCPDCLASRGRLAMMYDPSCHN